MGCNDGGIAEEVFQVLKLTSSCLGLIGDGTENGTNSAGSHNRPEPEHILQMRGEVCYYYFAFSDNVRNQQESRIFLMYYQPFSMWTFLKSFGLPALADTTQSMILVSEAHLIPCQGKKRPCRDPMPPHLSRDRIYV